MRKARVKTGEPPLIRHRRRFETAGDTLDQVREARIETAGGIPDQMSAAVPGRRPRG
ncbi:hypothetical protein [Nonomuraea sp. KM90]|uniref:hypothetical protein n=1 Tax=Nonomuraea sp. KM90 TaxID=3457428 RepID=UPI003FCC7AF1